MSGYTLKIVRNGSERILTAAGGKTLTVPAEYQTLYQIYNAQGELVSTPTVRESGMDLWVYLEGSAEGAPDVVLQNYLLNYPVVDLNHLAQSGATFATAAPVAYTESAVAAAPAALAAAAVGKVHTAAAMPTGLFGVIGGLGLAGVAVAAGGGKGGGGDSPKENIPSNPQSMYPANDNRISTPAVTIDPVGNISKSNPNQAVTVSGKLSNIDSDVVVATVTVHINGTAYRATVSPDKQSWSLTTTNGVLAKAQGMGNITALVYVRDGANNESISNVAESSYRVDTGVVVPQPPQPPVDTHISTPVITINPIGNISKVNPNQAVTVSGKLSNIDSDVVVATVTVHINGTVHRATVSPDKQSWSLTTTNGVLAKAQGTGNITALVYVRDGSDNQSISNTAESSYRVESAPPVAPQPPADTHISTPTVTVDAIANINKANQHQAVTLRGKLGQIDADVTAASVTVNINGKLHTAVVSPDKQSWSLNTSNGVLAAEQGMRNVSVVAHVRDGANNQASSKGAQTGYRVDTVLDKPVVSIDALGEVSRDGNGKTTVTGKVGGLAGDTRVNEVSVQLGGKTLLADLGGDGKTWSVQVSNADLLGQPGRQLTAVAKVSDTGGNSESGVAQGSYTVAAVPKPPKVEPEIGIRITGIDGDNAVGADRSPVLVRIKGTVNAASEPLFAQVQNRELLQSIELKLNGKSYEAGLSDSADGRHYTFTAYVPAADLRAADGQTLTYGFHYAADDIHSVSSSRGFRLPNGGRIKEDWVVVARKPDSTMIDKFGVTLEGAGLTAAGTQYRVNAAKLPNEQSSVSGQVYGEAQAGDAVEVVVNGKTYHTVVKAGQVFDVSVPTAELLADSSYTVRATLTANHGGKPLSAQDSAVYLTGKTAGAEQGKNVKHATDNSKLPYFIENLRAEWEEDHHHGHSGPTAHVGYLEEHPVGEAIEVRYRFFSQAEINNLSQTISSLEKKWSSLPSYSVHERALVQHQIKELKAVRDNRPVAYSDSVQVKMQEMLKHISDHTAVRFKQVHSPNEETDLVFFIHDTAGADGYAYFGGNVHLSTDSFTRGKFRFNTALHETLHSLGMKHPHKDAHEDDDVPLMKSNEDHKGLTVMSYNFEDFVETDSMRLFDLAYLHYRFGVNANQRSGNDVYTFKPFNRHSLGNDVYIWDGGGVDTFDASAQEQGVTVDLTPGSWIYAGSKTDSFAVLTHHNLSAAELVGRAGQTVLNGSRFFDNTFAEKQAFIGYGTQIENLIGSKYSDVLKGNKADNAIYGGAGRDVISGGDGNDWLDGGAGEDVLVGGNGNDTYIVGETGDKVVELDKGGNDHVYSSVNYSLGDHLEKLTLLGNALQATGNALDNTLVGNNLDNTLNGGAGKDVLTGGAGKDQFVFSSLLDGTVDEITDFTAGEDKIVLSRSVFTALRSDGDIAGHIRYDPNSGVLSYDADGSGGAAAVAFAKVSGLDELNQNIVLVA